MFSIFNRSKVYDWEKQMLIEILGLLPTTFSIYRNQLREGLIKGVLLGSPTKPNYISFTFNPEISSKYEDKKGSQITIKGVKGFDTLTNCWVNINIYLAFGLAIGYSTPDNKKVKIALEKFVLDNVQYDNGNKSAEVVKIMALLNDNEKSLINENEIYEMYVKNKLYYHLADIKNGDGDFIGIDTNKVVYKLTQDPFEITEMKDQLFTVLQNLVW